jgi:peptide-methionine (S)-S-oxide reductase
VTEITPFKNFYPAEDYHNYEKHEDAQYCSFVIDPKMHKLIQEYGDSLREEYK